MEEAKLTKKQRKALEFRNKIEKREKVVKEPEQPSKKRKAETTDESKDSSKEASKDGDEVASGEEPSKKKRKTRRGKKGKGVNGGKGPRFILFVGNLPYDITETELLAHFKNSNPDRFRLRNDKGIAFMEFDNDTKEIQSKMELALRMHHSIMRDRKINVELTVGGGGNSEARKQKLQDKNSKLLSERRERVQDGKAKKNQEDGASSGIHPSRLNLVNH